MSHKRTEQIKEVPLKKYESLLDIVMVQENEKQANAQGGAILSQQKHTKQLMTLVLLETLYEEDDAFFDGCFEVQDEDLIDQTVKAMVGNNPQKIQLLAQQIQKRLHYSGKAIQIWLQALLKYHTTSIVTQQLESFNEIKEQLQGNWNIGRIAQLRGKIDMVLASRRILKEVTLEEFENNEGQSQTGSSSKEQGNHQRTRQNDWEEEEDIEDESSGDDEEDEENVDIEENQKQGKNMNKKVQDSEDSEELQEDDDNMDEEDSDYLEI